MNVPTRAERRAAFAQSLQKVAGHPGIWETDACAIRAAVEVVLPEPSNPRRAHPDLLRRRAQFLALADAIEGGD
jgi:hypothetical protein